LLTLILFYKSALDHPVTHSFPTRRSSDLCGSVYTRQKRRFSTVCKSWHKAPTAQTIKLNGKPLRMLSRASAFSSGTILDSLTGRSEEHTSELQSRFDLVCRLLLEKKKKSL